MSQSQNIEASYLTQMQMQQQQQPNYITLNNNGQQFQNQPIIPQQNNQFQQVGQSQYQSQIYQTPQQNYTTQQNFPSQQVYQNQQNYPTQQNYSTQQVYTNQQNYRPSQVYPMTNPSQQYYPPQQHYSTQQYNPQLRQHYAPVPSPQPVQIVQPPKTKRIADGCRTAAVLDCPYCKKNITTICVSELGCQGWICVGIWCILFWPASCFPCCCSSCQDLIHYCPECKKELGRGNYEIC